MTFTAESNFKELDLSELLSIDGGGYWTGLGASIIGGMGAGLIVGSFTSNPVGVGVGVIAGGFIGGVLYVI